jgi:hypothetical protein
VFDRFRRRPRTDPEPPPPLSAEQRAELAAEADDLLRPGFRTRADVLDLLLPEPGAAPSPAEAAAIVEERWQARLAEQRSWPARTDVDRLDDAFAALDRSGIVARANFSCCSSCGFDEIDRERPVDRPSEGFVFFHEQDAEWLGDLDAAVLLAFAGWTRGGDAGTRAGEARLVGERVRAAVEEQGLAVEWDGSPDRRILVLLPDGRRRLPG